MDESSISLPVPRTASKRRTPEIACLGCGDQKADWGDRADGWPAPNGDYFCTGCWKHWHSLPDAEAATWTMPLPSATIRPDRRRAKQKTLGAGLDLVCRFGSGTLRSRGCDCCAPDAWRGGSALAGPGVFGTWGEARAAADSAEWGCLYMSWGWRARTPPIEEACGLTYADAHCHLDILLQNVKHGGPGWDSKMKVCKYWLDSSCPYGKDCDYAHGESERQPRDTLSDKDVEAFLKDCVVASGAGAAAPTTGREPARLRCVVTSLCELESVEDTRVLLAAASRVFPPGTSTIFCSFGCHPHNYREYTDEFEATLLAELKAAGRAGVAWGECGLDYCKNHEESLRPDERRRMVDVFARQARLAAARRLPLVVHTRDAEDDTMEVFRSCLATDHPIHVHAYQGSVAMMQECLAAFPGSMFGVSGMLTLAWPVENVVELALRCPLDRLILETDAPYLANGPYDVPRLAVRVAEMRGVTVAEVLEATTANCLRLYGIDQAPRDPAKV